MKISKRIFFILFAILNLLGVIFFYEKNILVFCLLILLSITAIAQEKSRAIIFIFLFGAIFGTVAEIIAIYFEVWSYSNTSFFGVPFWLIPLWGNASIFIYVVGIFFEKNTKNLKKIYQKNKN